MWVGGLLSLVDRQRRLWAEVRWEAWGAATLCRFVLLYNFESMHLPTAINLGYPSGMVSLLCATARGPSFSPGVVLCMGKAGA